MKALRFMLQRDIVSIWTQRFKTTSGGNRGPLVPCTPDHCLLEETVRFDLNHAFELLQDLGQLGVLLGCPLEVVRFL